MAGSGQQFKASLGAWAKQTKGNLNALVRQTAQQMAQNVVNATPVDTGFLRGSWQPAIGKPAADGPGPGGVAVVAAGMKAGQQFFLTNNAAYALRLEYGFVGEDSLGRKYNQAGRFFVQSNVKKWPQLVEQVAVELKLTK